MAHRLERRDDAERHHSASTDSGDTATTRGLDRRKYVRTAVSTVVAMTLMAWRAVARPHSSGALGEDANRDLLIDSTDGITRYELTVDGELYPGAGASRDADARISGSSTEGIVDHERRRYRFSGEIRDMTIDGDAVVYVESERIDHGAR